jgi:hypothetical protein
MLMMTRGIHEVYTVRTLRIQGLNKELFARQSNPLES